MKKEITWKEYKKKYSKFALIKYLKISFDLTRQARKYLNKEILKIKRKLTRIEKKLNKLEIIFTNLNWIKEKGTEWLDLKTGIGGEIRIYDFN